ncbi:Molybdopterin binding protein [Lichtheimia hyalospora FSU 10163]|nr:Molybdopterin binding protein [Lichtheimia hyalospora FSU 10163]
MTTCLTAACCIIGDEILNGKTQDTNSRYLAKFLFQMGIELKRIEVVGDDAEAIQITIRRLSSMHDFVFTSGGIGVTHDDISYGAIAQAYQLELRLDPDTHQRVQAMLNKRNVKDRQGYERLATFPYPAQLLRPKQQFLIPIVIVNSNIYILPGIPRLFELLVDSLKDHLEKIIIKQQQSIGGFHRMDVATMATEGAIAHILATIQARVLQDGLKIGSYPVWGDSNVNVVVSVVGKNKNAVQSIAKEIAKEINGWDHSTARL